MLYGEGCWAQGRYIIIHLPLKWSPPCVMSLNLLLMRSYHCPVSFWTHLRSANSLFHETWREWLALWCPHSTIIWHTMLPSLSRRHRDLNVLFHHHKYRGILNRRVFDPISFFYLSRRASRLCDGDCSHSRLILHPPSLHPLFESSRHCGQMGFTILLQ